MKMNENTTVIIVNPFEEHGWVKWCAIIMYFEAMVCCWILGSSVWKDMSKKLAAISFRPITHQLVIFSIVLVSKYIYIHWLHILYTIKYKCSIK